MGLNANFLVLRALEKAVSNEISPQTCIQTWILRRKLAARLDNMWMNILHNNSFGKGGLQQEQTTGSYIKYFTLHWIMTP